MSFYNQLISWTLHCRPPRRLAIHRHLHPLVLYPLQAVTRLLWDRPGDGLLLLLLKLCD